MNNVTRRISGTIRTTILGLSIGCLTLAGCTSSPTQTAARPPDQAGTSTATTSPDPQVVYGAESATTRPAPPRAPAHVTHAPPPAPVVSAAPKIGPNGFGGLILGMTFRQAKAAGFVRGNELANQTCGAYDLYFHGGPYGRVFISPDRGVEAIAPDRPVRTPEGVTIGTAATRAAAVYPDFDVTLLAQLGRLLVHVPGNPGANYRLGFHDHRVVAQLALQRVDQGCYE